MRVSIVLHAHLPWVRHAAPWAEEERWFHDALWTAYLPLYEIFRRHPGFTLSISPTLAAMLADGLLKTRFEAHLEALVVVNDRAPHSASRHYAGALAKARGSWLALRGDLLAAFAALEGLELWTTAATHAYLPGLVPIGGVEAQLAIGRMLFSELATTPSGTWLPECAIDDGVACSLGPTTTLVDEHALAQWGTSPNGTRFVTRHREASHRVWSREHGYPRHPSYRERHLDFGHIGPRLDPFPPGATTGLRYWRITGRPEKEPYVAEAAAAQADRDAEDFVSWLESLAPERELLVTAYDAELFGHWWYEGPSFLDGIARRIADSPHLELSTVGGLADLSTPTTSPLSSSWGRGGDHSVWIGPATASLWRHVHATHRMVRATAQAHSDVTGLRGVALDQAIRELLLLEASDWPFAIEGTPAAGYAARRFTEHHRRAWRFAAIAAGAAASPAEEQALERVPAEAGFLHQMQGDRLRDAIIRP